MIIFSEKNPDHILGSPYKASGRFGEVTKYAGEMNILNKIDTSGVLLPWEDNTIETVIEEEISALQAISDVEIANNIRKAIDKSERSVTEKVISKSKIRNHIGKPEAHELLSFEEVFKDYNPEISQEELKAFIWYKREIGQPLSEYWNRFYPENTSTKEMLATWVENGILCYYKGDLIPAYLFFAENLWERMENLDSDKADIIELYGEQVYERQYDRLKKLFSETVYQRRLILDDSDESKRLILLPTSDFSNQFLIKTLADEQPFKVKQIRRQEELGKPDFLNDYKVFGDNHRKAYEQFTLTEGFQYWMVKNRESINFRKGTNYLEIINVYLKQKHMPPVKEGEDKAKAKAEWERKRSRAKEEGDRLFGEFLSAQIHSEDKKRIERDWNSKFNGYQRINYNKVPVAFRVAKTYRNEAMEIRAEKREGVAFLFSEGSACIAYDVGFGKTWTAIFSIAQYIDSGYCKRPFIVVPNQTYKQWLSEIKGILPHVPINDLYNLSNDYLDELKGKDGKIEMVKENTISVLTYEGFEKIGFSEETIEELLLELYEILNQGGESEKEKTEKQKASFQQRLEMIVGRGLRGTMVNIEDLGFDFMAVDEAHAMKKIFTSVKGEAVQEGKRERMRYKINSGRPSSIGLKGFMISQYILKNNNYRNILLLTATPFTNSPLEIFSMLALVAYKKLQESEVNNLTNFFDNYIQVSNELIINSKLRPERKEIVTGFNNIPALQTLIFRFINFKNADTKDVNGNKVKIVRPDKYVLPLKRKLVNGEVIELEESEQINTALSLSPLQEDLMATIKKYVEEKISYPELCAMSHTGSMEVAGETLDEEDIKDETEGVELNEEDLNHSEKKGVRMLRGMNFARNLALSPYLHKCSGLGSNPTYLQYIETSPKLHYVMLCIKSVKDYHESRNQPVSGQIIYMDRGIEYFHLIAEYLVKVIGYKEHEVGIIKSQMKGGKSAKEIIKNKFLGMEYDEKTRTFKDIPDSERIKVIIGSSTIKEGMNLQRKSTVLHDCFVDWNPTDMIQLEGRIWRQGNEFGSVRIAIPLMENSMDVFMFQKLEEKTKRINQIWDIDNQSSVLKLEELNPAELKYELISDPVVIAELEVKEKIEKLRDAIGGIQYEIKRIDSIKALDESVKRHTQLLIDEVKLHREVKDTENLSVRSLIEKVNEIFKSQLDINGGDFKQKNRYNWKSPYKNGYVKPYWFNDFVTNYRTYLKEIDNFLTPKNLTVETVDLHRQKLDKEVKAIEKRIDKERSEDAIRFRAGEIEKERKKNKFEKKTLEERVEEFKRLNYLLDHKQVKEAPKVLPAVSCPPLDMLGNRRIDKEAIDLLERCVLNLPQTKAIHTISPDEYSEERIKLHRKIIEGLMKGKECVDTSQTQPICLLTGGLPGSGKSTFLKKYSAWLTNDKVFKIDADEIRAKLPEYKGWNATITHLETKDIVNGLLESLGEPCTFDLVYDGTMNKARNYIPLIDKIKKLGYKVFVVYMKISYDVSVQRVLERYEQTGRYVPMEVINDAYDKGFEAFETIKAMVDGYVLVDGITHEILEEGGEKIPESRGYQINEPPNRTSESEEELLLKEKEAEAQVMILKLIKKKLQLKNRAQIKNQVI
ncbi:MAG: zeta toxin family protein [Sporocytophaga sp.]|nr:zeta toxin family protein [Sporocytophaga sp.]